MLRKECEDVLESFGLGHLHASVSNHFKLAIVSECGKPFMVIQGIQFNRLIPSTKEITYAAELLDTFLGIHALDILEYISSNEKFKKLKTPVNSEYDCSFIPKDLYTKDKNYSVLAYIDNLFTIELTTFNSDIKLNIKKSIVNLEMLAEVRNYNTNKKKLAKAIEFLSKFHNYYDEQYRISELKNHLSVCNV